MTLTSFRPTSILRSHPSSRAWLARQYRDPYVKARLQNSANYRSRSAFKLVELDAKWKFLRHDDVRTVVDLGAAPGGWSQVVAGQMGWTDSDWEGRSTREMAESKGEGARSALDAMASRGSRLKRAGIRRKEKGYRSNALAESAECLGDMEDVDYARLLEDDANAPTVRVGRGTIVAVDLLRMEPIPGVRTLQMDFLSPKADTYISGLLREPSLSLMMAGADALERGDGKADVILSDMAANFTGNATADMESSITICESVFEFVCRHLRTAESIGRRKGGVLVLKHFAHPEADRFRKEVLAPSFNLVAFDKPPSSRSESPEGYWVCMGWKGVPSS